MAVEREIPIHHWENRFPMLLRVNMMTKSSLLVRERPGVYGRREEAGNYTRDESRGQ